MATENVLSYLDAYCERAGDPGLWAEPLNAVTNLCFIGAAILAGRALLAVPHTRPKVDLWLLVLLLFAIGVGSGFWHLFATHATMLMDIIPIGLFIYVYLVTALRRLFHCNWQQTAAWWLLYFVAALAAQKFLPPDLLNGTIMYMPTYVLMGVMAWALRDRDRDAARVFQHVLVVWSISLAVRTVDGLACDVIPVGTHFLWHVLNAWVLWRLLRLAIDRGARTPG